MNQARHRTSLVLCLLAAALSVVAACSSSTPAPKSVSVQPAREVPNLLRGTIGSEVTFLGVEPTLVSGYGLVVGLNGTGGDVLPESIKSTMEREMGLMGIGKSNDFKGTAIEGLTPSQLLRDKNVAVVLVQAAIPPGAPVGATFDVYVRAINASSLDGGLLWSTDLRIGDANTFGQAQARTIARSRGPVFINPFADPGKEDSGVTRTSGRVLDGGVVTNPLQIEMIVNTPSFQLVRSIASAINSRFPEGPGDQGATARGRSGPSEQTGIGGSIALRVPSRYRRTPDEFLEIVRHLRIDQNVPEQYARRYVEGVKAEPIMANDMAWCLEALGQKALPFIRELYEYPEIAPQMAGLRAGARLGDPRAASPLKQLALKGQGPIKTTAIDLLGRIDAGPAVDGVLKDLLKETDLVTRVAAYEALARRAERMQYNRLAAIQRADRDKGERRYSPTQLEILSELAFPGNSLVGVERRLVEDKFLLDLVPIGEPMIYIAQQGRPRIVLFGANMQVSRPSIVSTWSDRLMMSADEGVNTVRVYYMPNGADKPVIQQCRETLPEMIAFFAKKNVAGDPRPGLNLSYSDVVGVLHAMFKARATPASFATETDKLKSQLLAAASSLAPRERPETPEDKDVVILSQPSAIEPKTTPQGEQGEKPTVVPIEAPDKKK
jgi:hypothetical protein